MPMKHKIFLLVFIMSSFHYADAQSSLQTDTMYIRCTQTLDFAFEQANRLLKSLSGTALPNCVNASGGLVVVGASDWTSGFFPGELWYLSDYKKDATMQTNAVKFTQLLQAQQYTTSTHDLGFMMFCSYGNGFKITNNEDYKNILIQSAISLQTRYNSIVGCMRSWSFGTWSFPVIIDNMMNLELMCWATEVTGDSTYYKGAVNHALTTMKNHFRPNYSSYHLVNYNPSTGNVVGKQTVQGYSNESSWARGQAWGLYGYSMMYDKTGMNVFLVQAQHIADYILSNLPTDYIPYWDYNDPSIPNAPRDASAASVTASALIQLYSSCNNPVYLAAAEKILWNLSSGTYMNTANENRNLLLKHSTGSKPANSQVDVPIIYADYYFVEALCRYVKLKNKIDGVSQTNTEKRAIEAFPNPFKQHVTIQSSTLFDKIELVDIKGNRLYSSSFPETSNKILTIQKNLNAGIYFVRIYMKSRFIGCIKISR